MVNSISSLDTNRGRKDDEMNTEGDRRWGRFRESRREKEWKEITGMERGGGYREELEREKGSEGNGEKGME